MDNQGGKPSGNFQEVSIGWNIAAGMVLFSLGGFYIDKKRGGGVAATLIGVSLGLFYCGYEVWKAARRLSEKDHEQQKPQ